MQLLIDGHNLIGQMPDIHLDDPYDEEKLALRLRGYCIRYHHHCTVIFDNGLPSGRSRMSSGYVTVIFAPYRVTADTLIIRRIRDIHDISGFAVVTSDRMIVDAANRRGITVIRSHEFADALKLPGKTTSIDEDFGEDPRPVITAAEVAYWLEEFGVEVDWTPAPPKPAANGRKSSAKKGKAASNNTSLLPDSAADAPTDDFTAMFGQKAELSKHGRKLPKKVHGKSRPGHK